MRFGRFSVMFLDHVATRSERSNSQCLSAFPELHNQKQSSRRRLAQRLKKQRGVTAARSSTRKVLVRVRLEGFRVDSIAQTRVTTSMPVKTKLDLVARAIKPKTYISSDEGPRLQKQLAAGCKYMAVTKVFINDSVKQTAGGGVRP